MLNFRRYCQPPPPFIGCPECRRKVMREPSMVLNRCQCTVCKTCQNERLARDPARRCPDCSAVPYGDSLVNVSVVPNVFASASIEDLKVRCRFGQPNGGCAEVVRRKDLDDHEADCVHRQVFCTLYEEGCRWQGTQLQLAAHSTECAYHKCQQRFAELKTQAGLTAVSLERERAATQVLEMEKRALEDKVGKLVSPVGSARPAAAAQKRMVVSCFGVGGR